MAEQLLDNQPYITDEKVIAEFLALGIDPTGKTSTQLKDEINTAIAKESALVVFDPKDPLDYIAGGLTLSGLGTGAGLGIKTLRTAKKGKKAAENITRFQKLKSALSPVYKKTPTPGPTVTPLSGGAPYTQLVTPKVPFGLKVPQTLTYSGIGVKTMDESAESTQLKDQAALLQEDINALKVDEITEANKQIAEAQERARLAAANKQTVTDTTTGDQTDNGTEDDTDNGTQDKKSKISELFGSERFTNFLRNVGTSLTETGQIGTGLAQGAAKAAEERAAKELAIELETIKASGKGAIKPELKYKMDADYVAASTSIAENAGSLDFLNQIQQMLQISDVTGLKAYGRQIGYKFNSIFNANAKMDPKTAVENLLREISIGNAEEVLGQSSGRLSDKDIQLARQLVSEIEGLGGIIGSEDQILSILARRRADIERAQAESGTTLTRLENDYYRAGIRPPDTGLFDLLDTLNKETGRQKQTQQQDKTRILLNPKEEALAEAGAN
jgi:hypothetical protein